MSDEARLISLLNRLDGRPYPAYRDLSGAWDLGGMTLLVDRVQGDPFAAPSRLRLKVKTRIDSTYLSTTDSRVAAEDWLLRRFGANLVSMRLGSGRSGELSCLRPGPEVEERSSVRLYPDGTAEVRFEAGLPARGRRILGREAWALIDGPIRDAGQSLSKLDGLEDHVASVCFQRELRRVMLEAGFVAFIADGSVLPRESGVSQTPLREAIPFEAPPSLAVDLTVGQEVVRGMAIEPGVTVIVGGGFHGKSTLLHALQRGHLEHIPGDGRERVVAHPDAVKVRAEDGRSVTGVDISRFLGDLPGGRKTRPFQTNDASGSTSQAAAIQEAIESGARLLLIDEDTSATNLLVRDEIMRLLIAPDREPIRPLVEQVQSLAREEGVSTIIVVGGVGAYLTVADTVIGMNEYCAEDLGPKAAAVVRRQSFECDHSASPWSRGLVVETLEPGRVKARGGLRLRYGEAELDLAGLEQVLSAEHAWSIARSIALAHRLHTGTVSMEVILDTIEAMFDERSVDSLCPGSAPEGGLIRPRRHEVAAAINRLRTLRVETRT